MLIYLKFFVNHDLKSCFSLQWVYVKFLPSNLMIDFLLLYLNQYVAYFPIMLIWISVHNSPQRPNCFRIRFINHKDNISDLKVAFFIKLFCNMRNGMEVIIISSFPENICQMFGSMKSISTKNYIVGSKNQYHAI